MHFIRSIRKETSVFSLTSWPVMTKRNKREKHKHLYKKPLKSMDALLLPLKKRPMDTTKGSLPTSYQKANLVGAGTWHRNKGNCQGHPEGQLAKRDCWGQSPPRLQTPRTPHSWAAWRDPHPTDTSMSLLEGSSPSKDNTTDSRHHLPFSSCPWATKGRGKAVSKEKVPGSDHTMGIWLGLCLCSSLLGVKGICRNGELVAWIWWY